MSVNEAKRNKVLAEQAARRAKAQEDLRALTDKDEWPADEHQARFDALTRVMLNTPK